MSQDKPNLHMSFKLSKGDILPSLQKRIVLFLAKSGPRTVNETAKELGSGYKSLWTAFNSLKEKQLIQSVSIKSYRNRDYPRFWTSPTGVMIALFDGVSPQTLLEKSIEIYPQDTNLQAILEVSPILGTEAFKLAFFMLLEKGKLEQDGMAMVIATQMLQDIDISQLKPLLAILEKYPAQHETAKAYATEISEKMVKLKSLLK